MSEENSVSKWDIETPEWQWLTSQISREHSHINQRMTWSVKVRRPVLLIRS